MRAANPSQPIGVASGCDGVAATGPSTAKSRLEPPGARNFVVRVARRRHDQAVGTLARRAERLGRPVHPVASRVARVVRRAVPQHARAVTMRERHETPREREPARARPFPVAQLHQAQAVLECARGAREERVLVAVRRAGDAVDGRQLQRGQDARVGRQQRRDRVAARHLPRERLPVVAVQFAVPRVHAEEVELDVRVRIDELLHEPRRRASHVDAEFFLEFARQRRARRLARLELAAGKLPVARVRLAGGTLREQHLPVGPQQHGGGDADRRPPLTAGATSAPARPRGSSRTATRRGRCATRAAAPTAAPRACGHRPRARSRRASRRSARASPRRRPGSRPARTDRTRSRGRSAPTARSSPRPIRPGCTSSPTCFVSRFSLKYSGSRCRRFDVA